MKRSMFGILTLVLVLVMLVGVMPFALAVTNTNTNNYVQITGGATELTLDRGTASTVFGVTCTAVNGYTPETYAWTVTDQYNREIAISSEASCAFQVSAAGKYTVSVVVTYKSKDNEDSFPAYASQVVNVSSGAYDVSLNVTEITAYPNQSVPLPKVTVMEGWRTVDAEVTWNVASSNGNFTASKSITLIPTVKVGGQEISNVPTCRVTVVTPVLECESTSAEIDGSATLRASVTTKYTYTPSVTYQFTPSSGSGNGQQYNNAFTMWSSTAKLVPVTVTAFFDGNAYQVTPITAYISFYIDQDIEVTMNSGQSSFTFNSATALIGGEALSTLMLQDVSDSTVKRNGTVQFTTLGNSYYDAATLTLPSGASGQSVKASSLGNVKLTVNNTYRDYFTFGYDIYGDDGLQYGAGTVTVNFTSDGGDIVYKTDYSTAVTFDEDDFADFWSNSSRVTGSLDYVVFGIGTNVPAYGALYTTTAKKEAVTNRMAFQYDYRNASGYNDLDTVTYVPNSSKKTAYTVEIPFTAYGTRSGQVLTGTVVIELNTDGGDIVYKTDYSTAVTFDEDDFEDFWDNSARVTGSLDYVVFGVSSRVPAYGALYTTTAKSKVVTSSMAFQFDYRNASGYNDLDTVTYVPSSTKKDAYTVEIPFTAYGTRSGQTLTGTVVIELNSKAGDIVYKTNYSTAVTFDEDDFEDFWDNSDRVTGSLDYVVFGVGTKVPAYGALYTTTAKTKQVTSSMDFLPNYSSSGSASYEYDLDTVTYVPSSTKKDVYTVEIPFTAYGTRSGQTLSGTVAIELNGAVGDIVYATDYSSAVTFDEEDFKDFWSDASGVTGSLQYVVFEVSTKVPDYGALYTTTAKSKSVTSSMKFQPGYTNSANYYDLDTVTYVPSSTKKDAYTVEIPFTAYGSGSQTLTGTVVIEMNTSTASIYSTGVVFGKGTNSIAKQIISDYETAMDTDLCYVIFELPDVENGRLYYDYTTILDAENVSKKDEFYVDPGKNDLALDDLAFVPAAGRTGNVTLYYTGYDENGKNAYEGRITLNVVTRTASSVFSDVTTTSYSWAADSIDFLYYQDVVQGSGSKYSPASSITRGDFMIMLYRAFLEGEYGDYKVTSNFADVKKGTTSYSQETYQAVGVAKYLGIAQGDGTNFKPTTSITREEAMTLIYRTLSKMGLSLEYTANASASSFSDYKTVSSYAQTAITNLVKHGIVIGSNGKINPKSNITRAEMAVILHRVLTY